MMEIRFRKKDIEQWQCKLVAQQIVSITKKKWIYKKVGALLGGWYEKSSIIFSTQQKSKYIVK